MNPSISKIIGFLNTFPGQNSVLLALGTSLTGAGGCQITMKESGDPAGRTWTANLAEPSPSGDWVVMNVFCEDNNMLKKKVRKPKRKKGFDSEQINITITIQQLDENSNPTGPVASIPPPPAPPPAPPPLPLVLAAVSNDVLNISAIGDG